MGVNEGKCMGYAFNLPKSRHCEEGASAPDAAIQNVQNSSAKPTKNLSSRE